MGSIYLENWKVFNFHINLLSTITNQQLGCQIFGFRAKPAFRGNQARYFSTLKIWKPNALFLVYGQNSEPPRIKASVDLSFMFAIRNLWMAQVYQFDCFLHPRKRRKEKSSCSWIMGIPQTKVQEWLTQDLELIYLLKFKSEILF